MQSGGLIKNLSKDSLEKSEYCGYKFIILVLILPNLTHL